ncbi:MAG: A/G-specific adenine glycosylase, partial [Methylococcales bacterium]
VLDWAQIHGRRDLPWQQSISPHRVWIAEVMLQQTRVETVIPYFERFMNRFPGVADLADAPLDTVLAHWSGLGYYSRARNLHKAAGMIVTAKRFPDSLEALCKLPGIGRSTAGAILSVGFEKFGVILDGNVKRVLARVYAIEGRLDDARVKNELWRLSEELSPRKHCREYTQAIMDLGATVCTPHQPDCSACPWSSNCIAFARDRTHELPSPRKHKTLPTKSCTLLMLRDQRGQCYLVKRPPVGIWGGLWALPEFASKPDTLEWCRKSGATNLQWWPQKRHTFSHFHLDYTPVVADWSNPGLGVGENGPSLWCDPEHTNQLALPAPIKRLVERLGACRT